MSRPANAYMEGLTVITEMPLTEEGIPARAIKRFLEEINHDHRAPWERIKWLVAPLSEAIKRANELTAAFAGVELAVVEVATREPEPLCWAWMRKRTFWAACLDDGVWSVMRRATHDVVARFPGPDGEAKARRVVETGVFW